FGLECCPCTFAPSGSYKCRSRTHERQPDFRRSHGSPVHSRWRSWHRLVTSGFEHVLEEALNQVYDRFCQEPAHEGCKAKRFTGGQELFGAFGKVTQTPNKHRSYHCTKKGSCNQPPRESTIELSFSFFCLRWKPCSAFKLKGRGVPIKTGC